MTALLRTILLLGICAIASQAGAIVGVVRNAQTGKPVPEVFVEVQGTPASTRTDSVGAYALDDLSPGSYSLNFSRNGYEPLLRTDVYVPGDGDKRVDIELTPQAQQLATMTVRASAFRKAPDMATSTKTMDIDEILRSPGALADVQRAVQDLPSVASGGDNVNEVVVRGGVPGENLFLMDNIEIPNPNHFAQQGSGGGVISLLNPLLVKGLTFCAGAPPAQYGGKASSVLDVTLRDGTSNMVLGGVDLSVGGAGTHLEGPLWKGASFMLSGSKSFLDLVAHFSPETAVPRYWGAQAKVSQQLGNHKLTVNGIYGDNSIRLRDAIASFGTRGNEISAGGFVYATGMTLRSFWGERLSTTATVSATGNSFERREYTPRPGPDAEFFRNQSVEQEQTGKIEAALDLRGANRLIVGGYGKRADFNIAVREKLDTLRLYSAPWADTTDTGQIVTDGSGNPVVSPTPANAGDVGYKYGAYASAILRPWAPLKIVPGIRIDRFGYTGALSASPRLSAVYSVMPSLDMSGAFGVQYQDPDYTAIAQSPSNRQLRPKRALTGIGGVEYFLSKWSTKLSIEGYYKRYDGLLVDSSYLQSVPAVTRFTHTEALAASGKGKSYGVEFFAQKKLVKNFSGSAAYSYSRVWYQDARPGPHHSEWYPGDFDFRHNLTLTGGYKFELVNRPGYKRLRNQAWFPFVSWIFPLADRNEISAKFRVLGGRPFTEPDTLAQYRIWGIPADARLNASRYPAYHSLDLRWERRYGFGFLQMIYYFEFQNLYSRRNVWQYLYTDGNPKRATVYQLPFFPSGGMIIGF